MISLCSYCPEIIGANRCAALTSLFPAPMLIGCTCVIGLIGGNEELVFFAVEMFCVQPGSVRGKQI
jgi:hypothetical protein